MRIWVKGCSLQDRRHIWYELTTNLNESQIAQLRHAKEVITSALKNKTKHFVPLSRRSLKTIEVIMSGNRHFNKHVFNWGISKKITCRFCNDEVETVDHVLCKCNALHHRRMRYQGEYFINLKGSTSFYSCLSLNWEHTGAIPFTTQKSGRQCPRRRPYIQFKDGNDSNNIAPNMFKVNLF